MATITFKDGTSQDFEVTASPAVMSNLLSAANKTGYLTLWNDTDTLSVNTAEIRKFALRALP